MPSPRNTDLGSPAGDPNDRYEARESRQDYESGEPGSTVRPARAGDVAAIGAIQARCWRGPYASVLPAAARARLDDRALAEAWRPAVQSPPGPRHRVLVALGDGLVAGFIALAPATDADSDDGTLEIVALEVDPLHTRRGHGSRLLAAAADTARGLGGHRLQVWLLAGDDPREQLLTTAGLGRDGASRERALAAGGDGNTLREVRLSAWLRDPEPDHRPAPGPDGESEVGT